MSPTPCSANQLVRSCTRAELLLKFGLMSSREIERSKIVMKIIRTKEASLFCMLPKTDRFRFFAQSMFVPAMFSRGPEDLSAFEARNHDAICHKQITTYTINGIPPLYLI